MTTSIKHAPVALAALALLAGAAHAAAPTAQDLAAVKLYGEVTIAQDSVENWGPWEQFEPPAAGNQVTLAVPRGLQEAYRPIAQQRGGSGSPNNPGNPGNPGNPPVEPVALCGSASLCGFGAFQQFASGEGATPQAVEGEGSAAIPDIHPVVITGRIADDSVGVWPGQIQLQTTAMSTGQPLFADSGLLDQVMDDDGEVSVPQEAYARFGPGTAIVYWHESPELPEQFNPSVTQVGIYRTIQNYMQGEVSDPVGQNGWGVLGLTSSLSEITARKDTANYSGYTVDANGVLTPLDLTVTFANAKFSGVVNGGVDGEVRVRQLVGGGTALLGNVGYRFSGDVRGVNLIGTSASADDGVITKFASQGALYGPGARAAAGVVDITKTRAGEGGYQNARNVSAYIAVDKKFTDGGNSSLKAASVK